MAEEDVVGIGGILDSAITPPVMSPEQQQVLEYEAWQDLASDTVSKRDEWRMKRQPHEREWFINAAMYRGNHYVEWNDQLSRLSTPKAPPHRVRLKIPRIQAKLRARLSKSLKNRPKVVVVPATSEYQDYLNAKATQKLLDYLWRKARLESRLKQALLWSQVCGKGFWWMHWDPSKIGRVGLKDPLTGRTTYEDRPLGDVLIEVGSAFEVLVADPGIAYIGDQPEIMRIKLRNVEDLKARYPYAADEIRASGSEETFFTYEQQIAGLNPFTWTSQGRNDKTKYALVTEHFIRPNATTPSGHYRVLVGNTVVYAQDELPSGFADMDNPYPTVEFFDTEQAGQFWVTTICAQMVDLQREYNLLRSKLSENLRVMAHPKILVARQHQLPPSSWTSEAGEIVEYIAVPNLPPPQPWVPPNIAGDLWQAVGLLQKEFDDVSQVFPASEGKVSGATSGFQTNLLQEATDSVHGPDIRRMELSVEEAMTKIRRLVKANYSAPRLVSVVGANYEAEILEFSSAQVDEMADVIVEVGSALPTLKAAKQEAVLNLYKSGMLGDPADAEVQRRSLSLLEMGSIDQMFDAARADEHQAELENIEIARGAGNEDAPRFWENHLVHYNFHTLKLKSAEIRNWRPEQVRALITHAILHARFINPQAALQMAEQEGIPEVIPVIQAMLMAQMQAQGQAPGAPPPGAQAPPPGAQPPPQPGPRG